MIIGIISDTHDHLPAVKKAIALFNQQSVGLVIHAGDFVAPFTVKELENLHCKVIGVFGNNDGEKLGLKKAFEKIGEIVEGIYIFELNNRKIVVTHWPEIAEPLWKSGQYDIVIYGHTHQVESRQNKSLLINPGECGGWLTGRCTVALLDLIRMEVRIHDL